MDHPEIVPRLVCDGEGQPKTRVFIDGTAAVFAAHPTDGCKTQRVTGLVLPGADVESSEEDGMIVPLACLVHQTGLPLAEAVQ